MSNYYPNTAELGVALRKSSYSNESADCVGAAGIAGEVIVSDLKNPTGPAHRHQPQAWTAFAQAVGSGTLAPVAV
ncbi:DUF397 domain-containing protein [Kitasatospora sp. MAP12-44]|uniref:DUF397 domain-containing protein n=1 Tax=unclassified Kitasatospora TaxID=2633591 RepID=UPI002474AC66|nr:DUF397 domain-containing protein [Kitasatospora sp. MAP12-44]MDH6107963.1 hypothetical protein [Kitasatospora sp. MAP12-44]